MELPLSYIYGNLVISDSKWAITSQFRRNLSSGVRILLTSWTSEIFTRHKHFYITTAIDANAKLQIWTCSIKDHYQCMISFGFFSLISDFEMLCPADGCGQQGKFCLSTRESRELAPLRDGWPHQSGWIFGKVPNGLWPSLSFSENLVANLL